MLARVPVLVTMIGFGIRRRTIMSLKSVAGKTCVWCVAATIAGLTLLAVTWTVILVSN